MIHNNQRLYYLDTLRAFLMILGIFIHSAQVFNPNGTWLISSSSTSALMVCIIEFIHWFRMPAFFVVSGYFCYISLKKYKISEFISLRVNRIIIPFITTALTLNAFQLYIIDISFYGSSRFDDYLTKGYFLSHLWFLLNILIYFFITLIIKELTLLSQRIKTYTCFLLKSLTTPVCFALFPAFEIIVLSLNKFGLPIYDSIIGNVSLYTTLTYFPYFLFGLVLAYNKHNMLYFSTRKLIPFLLASLSTFYLYVFLNSLDSFVSSIASNYLHALSTYFLTSFLFSAFFKYSNKKSSIAFFLADSAYTVYLFHHLLVILIGIFLIKLAAPWYIGYPVLIVLVTVSCLVIHKNLILRFKIFRFLFNGKTS